MPRPSWLLIGFAATLACSEEIHHTPPGACTPACAGKMCGNDGCGGSCGACPTGEGCTVAGRCAVQCVPTCTNRLCGSDGCGGSCGECTAPQVCLATAQCGACVADCTNRVCGSDGCGGSCGPCNAPMVCSPNGQCEAPCVPNCTGKECGSDGCTGSCGDCTTVGESCDGTGQCAPCIPNCTGNECGDNGCGGSCGSCPSSVSSNLMCTAGGVCTCDPLPCVPDCAEHACGDDGCGGTCGDCNGGDVCAYDRGQSPNWQCRAFTAPDPNTGFFLTSVGPWASGGDLGGLAGADAVCQARAQAAGLGARTWHAYLSATGMPARARIGAGPWKNVFGVDIVPATCGANCVAMLHSVGLVPELVVTEIGTQADWVNAHDVWTGSDENGMPSGDDCSAWTSNADNVFGMVGHSNGFRPGNTQPWNSVHTSGCSQAGIACTAGRSLLYCFAL